jgi:hypothetical protein
MSLPVNIEELLNGHTVEWECIECKLGWNPLSASVSVRNKKNHGACLQAPALNNVKVMREDTIRLPNYCSW